NFANWWTYYRTRMQGMKTAASLAFKPIDARYRVGFINIHNGDYLPIDKFESGAGKQKDDWYEELFEANPSGGTPLRASLATVGRIYAGQYDNDPVQYSCQQNFALLTTDGYWNGNAGVKVNGWSSIDNQDGGNTPRPMYGGPVESSGSL